MDIQSSVEDWYIVALTDKAFISMEKNIIKEHVWSIVEDPVYAIRFRDGIVKSDGLTVSRLADKFGGKVMKMLVSESITLEDLGE